MDRDGCGDVGGRPARSAAPDLPGAGCGHGGVGVHRGACGQYVLGVIFVFQAEDGIRDYKVTGVQTCALPIYAVVGVMGNNGIWGLEHHPMTFLYGYSVAAELRPETRYDQVVEALGGHGELVHTPEELRPALDRAFSAGKPALVNAITDPSVAYPRKSNLA